MKRALVPIDGSDYSWKALDEAIEYILAVGGEITVLHVVPAETIPTELKKFAQVEQVDPGDASFAWRQKAMLQDKIIAEAKRRLEEVEIDRFRTVVYEGDPAEQILSAAHDADIIFMGHRGLGALRSLLMGSVAHKVVNLSKCTCAIVK